MINTRKRSGCLIKEQIIYLARKSVQHNPEMWHCWPRRARKTRGRRDSSSAVMNTKNAPLLQNVSPDVGRQWQVAQVGPEPRMSRSRSGGTSPSSEKKNLAFKIPQRAKFLLSLALQPPPPSQYLK